MASPFRPTLDPHTGLWSVLDEAGESVAGHETIPCLGEAQDHILDLIHAAQDDTAALDDFEAQQLAEAA